MTATSGEEYIGVKTMTCASCGRSNVDGALYCAFCGVELRAAQEAMPPPSVVPPPPHPGVPYPYTLEPPEAPTSGMAIASLVLGVLGFVTMGLTSLVGLVLGIAGLLQISGAGGRLRGQGFAIAGTIVSGLTLLMLPVMAAITLPVFVRAREKARQAACQSNEKQLALGGLMYAQDYDEVCPMKDNWADGIMPYVKNTQIFICPSERNQTVSSYGYSERLDRAEIRKVPRPGETVMLFDSQPGTNRAGGQSLVAPRHINGANLAFLDGHVKWMDAYTLGSVVWDPTGQ